MFSENYSLRARVGTRRSVVQKVSRQVAGNDANVKMSTEADPSNPSLNDFSTPPFSKVTWVINITVVSQ